MGLRNYYVGYLWQGSGLDALVLRPPLDASDDDLAFARQLYHRHVAHLMATRLWQAEWIAIAAAGLIGLGLHLLWKNAALNFILIAACLLIALGVAVGARYLAGWLFGDGQREKYAADTLVRRVCIRPIRENTPADLDDPWRHGWLLADGRPVAAEIAETDLRATDAVPRASAWLWLALAIGLLPLAATIFAAVPLAVLLILALIKAKADPNPAALRARLLDVAAAHSAEAATWSTGGASKWASQVEAARQAQMKEAIRDTSPLLHFGTALGILAARGDALAPSAGLPVALSLKDLMQHLLVLGGTGAGKTAGVLRPLCKQTAALERVGLFVMDGKGALPGEVAAMIPGFTIIDPASKAISLVEGLSPTEIASTIREILADREAKDKFFDDGAMALLRFAATLAKLDDETGFSLTAIWQIARDGPPQRLLDKVSPIIPEQDEAASFFTTEWPAMEVKTRASITATLRTWYATITGHLEMGHDARGRQRRRHQGRAAWRAHRHPRPGAPLRPGGARRDGPHQGPPLCRHPRPRGSRHGRRRYAGCAADGRGAGDRGEGRCRHPRHRAQPSTRRRRRDANRRRRRSEARHRRRRQMADAVRLGHRPAKPLAENGSPRRRPDRRDLPPGP